MSEVWLAAGKRTPIGKFLGELAPFAAPSLAGWSIRATLAESGLDDSQIGEGIVGQVITAGVGQAPARQALLEAGLSEGVGAVTVNKVCGSGLFAAMLASRTIRAGDHRAIIAAGMESMSQAPHLLRLGRTGWKYGGQPLLDAIEVDGLCCSRGKSLMGVYAERVAQDHGITRAAQDEWSLLSHQRAIAAQERGDFASEIVPLSLSKDQTLSRDSGPRSDTNLEKLSRLRPAFDPKGTVTAGNSSSLSDGAASVLVVDGEVKKTLKTPDCFRMVSHAVMSQKPEDLFVAPVGAVRKLFGHKGLTDRDIDLYEINEAFASQTLACIKLLGINPEKVNVNGGAIALGHPIGCSGMRVLVTLMNALSRRNLTRGVAALCLGGGEAVAMMIEREKP